jgi:CRP-like cAMP-binding protein
MADDFISALPADTQAELRTLTSGVRKEQGGLLHAQSEEISCVYFPRPGTLVSIVIPLSEGETIETGFVGHTGLVGGSALLNGRAAFNTAMVQLGGDFDKAPVDRVRALVERDAELRGRVINHEGFMQVQSQQTAACNAVHRVETRLCRWMLQARDMVESDTLDFTQEFISHILGVRRTTVTLIARQLQSLGFIKYSRGRIKLIDLAGLEEASCECHKAIISQYERLVTRRSNAS